MIDDPKDRTLPLKFDNRHQVSESDLNVQAEIAHDFQCWDQVATPPSGIKALRADLVEMAKRLDDSKDRQTIHQVILILHAIFNQESQPSPYNTLLITSPENSKR